MLQDHITITDELGVTQNVPVEPVIGFRGSSAAWVTGATAQDVRAYGAVEAQIAGLSGGDTIAFTTSNDGVNYVPVNWIDRTLATGSTITANQIYTFPGGGYLKWTKTGVASTPTVTVRAAS